MKLTEGELITVSVGCYSDYCVNGLFRVLRDFDAAELLPEWVKTTKYWVIRGNGKANQPWSNIKGDWSNRIDNTGYMSWLSRQGYIEDVDYREMHIGDYEEIDLDVSEGSEEPPSDQ